MGSWEFFDYLLNNAQVVGTLAATRTRETRDFGERAELDCAGSCALYLKYRTGKVSVGYKAFVSGVV